MTCYQRAHQPHMATWARGLWEASEARQKLKAGSEQHRSKLQGAAELMLQVADRVATGSKCYHVDTPVVSARCLGEDTV